MNTHLYQTEVTFADTNLVGNVYFANYFRWQDECRNDWLKQSSQQLYWKVARGEKRLRVSEASFEYHDPQGVTVAEPIEVEMQIETLGPNSYRADAVVRRRLASGLPGSAAPTARGRHRFELVDNCDVLTAESPDQVEFGQAYAFNISNSLDLFRGGGWIDARRMICWQGKCRERFLITRAPKTLQSVAERSLALHTSKVGLLLERDVRLSTGDTIGMEMRLTHLRGGRMTMHFAYFLSPNEGDMSVRKRFAAGAQSICCKRTTEQGMAPAVFPVDLLHALRAYANSPAVRSNIDAALAFHRDEGEFSEFRRRSSDNEPSAKLVG